MKKYIICILLLSILTSCTQQPKCDSDEALQLAKDLIKQELKSDGNLLAFEMFGMGDENTIDEFVDENIELKSVRTTEKNDELKTCSCASQIIFKFSEEFEQKMKENGKENIISTAINDILKKQIGYYYNLQILEKEKNLYIEGIVPKEELTGVLTNYMLFAPKKETKEVETENNESQSESNNTEKSEEDYYYAIVKNAVSPIYKEPKRYTKTDKIYEKGDTIYFKELRDGWILFDYYDDNEKLISGYSKVEDLTIKKE